MNWYWVSKRLICLYIWKKINGDDNQPTYRQGDYRAICLFKILDNRKKAEICNSEQTQKVWAHEGCSPQKKNSCSPEYAFRQFVILKHFPQVRKVIFAEEKYNFSEEKKIGKEKEENIWRMKYIFPGNWKLGKEKVENIWKWKIYFL